LQRLALTLLFSSMLFGCAGYQPKDIFAQSREWLAQTSDGAAANYDDEIEVLFAQPYIDPLTDYINQHIDDERRAEPLRKVSAERKVRCQEIADKYLTRPLTQESLNLYKAGYSYSCPKDVEQFAVRLAEANKQAPTASSQAEPPVSDEKVVVDKAIVSNVNKEQLNDCYLLTTISNFREAKQACLPPANKGDVRSQLNMAVIHKALTEYSQSLQWAEKVEQDSPRARYLIGEIYALGLGVQQDYQTAFEWFEKSGQDGYAEAQHMLGLFYEMGKGTQQNKDLALKWFQRAALNNYVPAKHSLGALLIQQNKNPASITQAEKWLIQAARAGYAESSLLMGRQLQQSDLTEKKAKAVIWYEVAQQQGSAEAEKLAENLRPQVNPEAINLARQQIQRVLDGQN